MLIDFIGYSSGFQIGQPERTASNLLCSGKFVHCKSTALPAAGGLVWALTGPLLLDFSAPYTTGVIAAALVYPAVALIEARSSHESHATSGGE
ncbi:MAG: hypothetical protein KJ622_07685 [Alphaproteobacteria bacterium]|nr:hypothetical protein [Alphaproteobacteria bacterium]